jgi:amino acid permease
MVSEAEKNAWEPAAGFQSFDKNNYWTMLGSAFSIFQSIGCLMPIAKEAKNEKDMAKVTSFAFSSFFIVYVCFSFFCYFALGSKLDKVIVTEELPAD